MELNWDVERECDKGRTRIEAWEWKISCRRNTVMKQRETEEEKEAIKREKKKQRILKKLRDFLFTEEVCDQGVLYFHSFIGGE